MVKIYSKPFVSLFALCLLFLSTGWVSAGEQILGDTATGLLRQARLLKKGSYTVRSHHLEAGEPMYTNRLILEDSPYLLQHAHNPVNWYGWGDEAFAAAREQNKPVFLSIGYSTCHWCHVMEDESFDNEAVAAILNRYFISIKVDREQRPDLDEIYMMGVQLIIGRGGWPMSNFLTVDGKPFYGGTYYPKEQFIELLQRVHQAWVSDQSSLISSAEKVYTAIQQQLNSRGQAASIGQQHIDQALRQIISSEDRQHGGRKGAPKFPNETSLQLLLGQVERSDKPLPGNRYWTSLYRALSGMLRGGIYDQVGGGFHRYSTDEKWLIPHFEKMLYNQAQLSRLYARAWKLSGEQEFRRIAEETLDYVLREMRSAHGGFYSATDADSEGEEGKYFVWQYDELKQLLSAEQLTLVEKVYGVTEQGNFEGANLLYLVRELDDAAGRLKSDRDALLQRLTAIKRILLDQRNKRLPPLRDDKVITEWNGMMITALAEAGYLLEEPRYVAAAAKAAEFIWQHNRDEQGLLYRIHLNGRSGTQATLEDYSFYLEAVLALYDASGNRKWLNQAKTLHQQMTTLFWEKNGGGFYVSQASTDGPMIIRSQGASDGATASGNSVALVALVSLNQRSKTIELQQQIDQQIVRFSSQLNLSPLALSYMLTGIAEQQHPRPHTVQYASDGHVRVAATMQQNELAGYQLSVELAIEQGWHINANKIAIENLVATELTLENGRAKAIHYPTTTEKMVTFSHAPLALYQGTIEVLAELEEDADQTTGETIIASITLQACSDTLCLQPEILRMVLRY